MDRFVHNETAFLAFSYGPMNCVGKNRGMLTTRMVVCALLQRFRIRLGAGWDSASFEKDYKDYLVALRPDLPVVLDVRYPRTERRTYSW